MQKQFIKQISNEQYIKLMTGQYAIKDFALFFWYHYKYNWPQNFLVLRFLDNTQTHTSGRMPLNE